MKKRVFIGLVEIAGYYENLAQGLRELGYDVKFVGSGAHIFEYESSDQGSVIVDLYNRCLKKKSRTPRHQLVAKVFWAILVEILKIPLFFWSLATCDIFIFSFGTTFFYYKYDLLILKIFNKKIICNIGHGSDARPPFLDGVNLDQNGKHLTAKQNYKESLKKKRFLKIIERYSDTIISSPFTGHFLHKPFINWYFLGIPQKSVQNDSSTPKVGSDKIRVLHAPSNPQIKGTARIRAAVEKLQDEGFNLQYEEIIGRPNDEVIASLKSCDLVIDQLYSDTPLAGFATEAAWQKRATIVGGYVWQELAAMLPKADIPPSFICDSENFEETLREILSNQKLIEERGERVFEFVSSKWSTEQVAKRYRSIIDGNYPAEWIFNPQDITYVKGGGLKEIQVRQILKELIEKYGSKGLCLGHNPALEKKFIDFAMEEKKC